MIGKRRPREKFTEFGRADALESVPDFAGVARIRYCPELTVQFVNHSIDHDGRGVSHINFETVALHPI